MESLARFLLVLLVAAAFLLPIQLFLAYRFRRAERRGLGHQYVALTDPWLPVLTLISGALLTALLWALR
jgi:hypothetical protein